MTKITKKIAALLLVPCLLADPALCTGFSSIPDTHLYPASSLFFQEQALIERMIFFFQRAYNRLISAKTVRTSGPLQESLTGTNQISQWAFQGSMLTLIPIGSATELFGLPGGAISATLALVFFGALFWKFGKRRPRDRMSFKDMRDRLLRLQNSSFRESTTLHESKPIPAPKPDRIPFNSLQNPKIERLLSSLKWANIEKWIFPFYGWVHSFPPLDVLWNSIDAGYWGHADYDEDYVWKNPKLRALFSGVSFLFGFVLGFTLMRPDGGGPLTRWAWLAGWSTFIGLRTALEEATSGKKQGFTVAPKNAFLTSLIFLPFMLSAMGELSYLPEFLAVYLGSLQDQYIVSIFPKALGPGILLNVVASVLITLISSFEFPRNGPSSQPPYTSDPNPPPSSSGPKQQELTFLRAA